MKNQLLLKKHNLYYNSQVKVHVAVKEKHFHVSRSYFHDMDDIEDLLEAPYKTAEKTPGEVATSGAENPDEVRIVLYYNSRSFCRNQSTSFCPI